MPGLSQLKKFSNDMLSLGDEVSLRARRGEKPLKVEIPDSIADVDDSEDFVIGMPVKEAVVEEAPAEEDFSDLMGIAPAAAEAQGDGEQATAAPDFSAPDMSDLLNLGMGDMGGETGGDDGMPDLSMFEDEPEPEPEEEKPEEISIADMSLDALLAGAGFDEPEPESEAEEPAVEDDLLASELEELADTSALDDGSFDEFNVNGSSDISDSGAGAGTGTDGFDEVGELDDIGELDEVAELNGADNVDFNLDDLSEIDSAGEADAELNSFDEINAEETSESVTNAVEEENAASSDDLFDLEDFGVPVSIDETVPSAGTRVGKKSDGFGADGFDYDSLDFFDDELSAGFGDGEADENSEEDSGELPEENPTEVADEIAEEAVENAGNDSFDLDDIEGLDDLGDAAGLDAAAEATAPLDDLGDTAGLDDVAEAPSLDDLGDTAGLDDLGDLGEIGGLDDIGDTAGLDDIAAAAPLDDLGDTAGLDDVAEAPSLDDLGDTAGLDDVAEVPSLDDLGDTAGLDDLGDLGDIGGLDDIGDTAGLDDIAAAAPLDDLEDTAGLDAAAEATAPLDDLGDTAGLDDVAEAPSLDDLGDTAGLDDLGDLGDIGGLDDIGDTAGLDDIAAAAPLDDLGDTAGLDDMAEATSLDNLGDTAGLDDVAEAPSLDDLGDTAGLDDLGDLDSATDSLLNGLSSDIEMPDYKEVVAEDDISDAEEFNSDADENAPLETFDTTGMEDMDFGITDTDTHIEGASTDEGFDLGSPEDFAMEGDFEIPGFSDAGATDAPKTEDIKAEKKSKTAKQDKGKKLDEPDFSNALVGEELPPNTLTDAQYKQFLKNFAEYPLNVRLALENLIVQDEFTEDAEFEVIEKILHKAPARQVASMLEKMLDISIPVPRDYEHRSAEEYEAYKKSISYQLRNKIIPGFLVGCVLLLVGFGLFKFVQNCIYKPIQASKHYKQGYALLQADEYPQSELEFNEAVHYRLNKNWFFNYARGYREHKQYQRAEKMYQNILYCFNHDKAAGLEYADMEMDDLVNYPRAEEIVRREILDYHINDAEGLLKLGDVYLEWGTEKDPAKLELAREQYASLIQLYKTNSLYLGRMMRYFIRSDKLRQVLEVKQNFTEKDKALSADDWTELSGYLLEKYYGPLPASQEYLRFQIEGLRGLLLTAARANPENPIALYNLSKYYVYSNEVERVEKTLQDALSRFDSAKSIKRRDMYKYIDSYRLLGEYYENSDEYIQAQQQFAEGISLYTDERDNAGFEGNAQIGVLYEDMADLKYFVSADYDDALKNYMSSVELGNDSPKIRYRIGYIQYNKNNLTEALGSFMKAGDGNVKERNLMLAMANTLSLRGDDYAAEGYYNQLISRLDNEIAEKGLVLPQVYDADYDLVNTYLSASNNYGVTLYNLAKRTGNSSLNAKSIVQFQQSVRAWDAMTRNQESMVRLPGTNLAEQNIKYVTHRLSEYEPAIYTAIPKTLTEKEKL